MVIYEFTSKQKSLRKEWLIFTILKNIMLPLIFLVGALSMEQLALQVISLVIASIVLSLINLLIPYFCAYAKPGTRYLTFLLFVTPLGVIKDLGESFKSGAFGLCMLLVSLLVTIWWYALTIEMRKLNRMIKTLNRSESIPTAEKELSKS